MARLTPGDTASKVFDIFIVTLILLNVASMILESVASIYAAASRWFTVFEYVSVGIFSVEYGLRVWSCAEEAEYRRPVLGRVRFALTPLALVDLLAVLPFYLPFLNIDLRVLRMFRIARIMRIAKLGRYSESLQTLLRVLHAKKEQLLSAVFILLILLVVAASLMYYAEHSAQPQAFSSIPAHVVGRLDAHHGWLRRCLSDHNHWQVHGLDHRGAGDRHVRPADRHPRRRIRGRTPSQEAISMPPLREGSPWGSCLMTLKPCCSFHWRGRSTRLQCSGTFRDTTRPERTSHR